MKFTHEGLSLWFGTPDAPAPVDEVVSRAGSSVTVGVRPPSPTNAVHVRYRLDGGIVQTVPGRELRTDHSRAAQYFVGSFPAFPAGHVVEYCPVLTSVGRQVPDPSRPPQFPVRFSLSAPAPRLADPSSDSRSGPRFALGLRYLASVTMRFEPPQFVGETPEGFRIDFVVREGIVAGPDIRGKVLAGSSDHMSIRPDGIGVIHARAAIATEDGAMIELEYTGSVEFGEDGYRRAVARQLPRHSPFVIAPRIVTGHSRYSWLNRLQCIGAGRTSVEVLMIEYDLFGPSWQDHGRDSVRTP